MTQVEAMKLALEALEWNLPVIEDYGDKEQLNRQHNAITALRQAIEQKQEPVGINGLTKAEEDETASVRGLINTIPPQQKQEPVGRFSKFTDGVWKEVTATSAGQPLYAYPPQRQWVGLTDEDLKLLSAEWRIVYGAWVDDFARDIEAKLKEKNTEQDGNCKYCTNGCSACDARRLQNVLS